MKKPLSLVTLRPSKGAACLSVFPACLLGLCKVGRDSLRLAGGLLLCLVFLNSTAQVSQDSFPYPWFNLRHNYVQLYDRDALSHLHKQWGKTEHKKLVIVDLGDSHLQTGTFPANLRKELQKVKGDGGMGMLTAYSAAKTYSDNRYSCSHTGEWTYAKSLAVPAKLPLGASGMTVRTETVGATLTFKLADSIPPPPYTVLKLFVKKESSFDVLVSIDSQSVLVKVDSFVADSKPYIEVSVPAVVKQIKLQTLKRSSSQLQLEFYGMSLETAEDKGVLLHNMGVGGAQYHSILYQDLFVDQTKSLEPDLVIIDFGTNDYLYDDSIKPTLDSEIVAVIRTVRLAAPKASVIVTSTMDMYRKGINVRSGYAFSQLMHDIAKRENCGLYDWYWVSGGPKVMSCFLDSGICGKDMIHLNRAGSAIKGKLFAQAIMNTMNWLDSTNRKSQTLLFEPDSIELHAGDSIPDTLMSIASKYFKPEKKSKSKKGGSSGNYTVRSGDTLYGISRKYGVSVDKIMKANGMKNTTLQVGERLIIPK